LSKSQFQTKINRLTQKYRHIPMFDFDHEPYTADHFLTEIKAVRRPQAELNKIRQMFVVHHQDFKSIVKKIKPDQKFSYLLEFLKENVFLRDYRDMIRQKLNLELRKLYSEIGSRLRLSVERVAALTNEEIIYYLKNSLKFPAAEAKRREEAYLLRQKGKRVEIYSGSEAKRRFIKELGLKKKTADKEIRGIIGSKGLARGRVKIIYTNRDLPKIKLGDILVAAMTRQDFVPVMRKAKAIITDEGGVICHAAIIARELKIPAIVGTKNATQVLHDGDLVEVDANRGIVRIV
jgi:phosphoenolpyruvate synthase/pyruvate phosphate dikinase